MNAQIAFDARQQRAVRNFAMRVQRRLTAAGARACYQDVFQELCIAWCKARDAWSPEHNVPFLAYLQRGMMNHINRWAEREIGFSHLTPVSIDRACDDENGADFTEVLEDPTAVDPVEKIGGAQLRARLIAKLSAEARMFLLLLEDPPSFLRDAVAQAQERSRLARQRGFRSVPPTRVTVNMVFDFMGLAQTDRKKVLGELEKIVDRRASLDK